MASEAGPLRASMAAEFKLLPELGPSLMVDLSEFSGGVAPAACCGRCQEPSRTSKHQPRRSRFPTARSPLVVAMTAEELFQVVVRSRQIADPIAMKQPRPIAAGDFQEVSDGRLQAAG